MLALDIDDVLIDFNNIVLNKVNREFISTHKEDNFEDLVWNFLNLEKEKLDRVNELFGCRELHNELTLYDGAIEFVSWAKENFDVIFVTSAFPNIIDIRDSFIRESFGDDSKIIYTQNKNYIRCDVMVDDSPQNIITSSAAYPIIMDKPWNKHLDGYRVSSFEELKRLLIEIDKGKS